MNFLDEILGTTKPMPHRYNTRVPEIDITNKSYSKRESEPVTPTYTVKKGDSMWRIAHNHNISLAELQRMNPQIKNNTIFPDDKVNLDYQYEKKLVNLKDEEFKEDEYNKNNISAIQHATHDSNYVIIDKKNRKLSIFDKDNNLLYSTNDISTGKNKTDYNTVTYQGNGSIQNYAGNNSTPAGILKITGKGEYHGAPSFTRARFNPETGKPNQVNPWVKDNEGNWYADKNKLVDDNVASSFHVGNTANPNSSNGCVRIGEQALKEMSKYLKEGDITYTLPEDNKSRFVLRGGKLNFVADNPYGITEKGNMSKSGHDMVNWDDYNTHIDKSYNPLIIKRRKDRPIQNIKPIDSKFISNQSTALYNVGADIRSNYNTNTKYNNEKEYATTISVNKKNIQKKFNLSSYEYNKLAQLAMGIANQESKFGTANSYITKNKLSDGIIDALQFARDFKKNWSISKAINAANIANSKGLTQIKYKDDIKNKELKKLYESYGITENSLNTAKGSALATMIRLAHVYNNEIKGRTFKSKNNNKINSYDALLYKYQGKHKMLKSGNAEPEKNTYIRNVKKYLDDYDYYEERNYKK